MTANPEEHITIHDLASLINVANPCSFTAENITSAFAEPGIQPYSKLTFSVKDFEPSNRVPNKVISSSDSRAVEEMNVNEEPVGFSTTFVLTSESVRPYPKDA